LESAVEAPKVSVIVVCDYDSGEDKAWDELREVLAALARQDYEGPVEYLLMESSVFQDRVPADLTDILPTLKICFFDSQSSYALKNRGAEIAEGEILGVLDGDCTPDQGWVRCLADTFRTYPETAVVSGRTIYSSGNVTERTIGLLSRSYLDRRCAAPTDSIANNNAGFTRQALLAHPFLDDIGAFGGKLQAETMRQAGLYFRFEPGMLAVHAYEGREMEKDIRRQTGYATVMVRRIDSRIAHSWLTRIGSLSIPLFLVGRILLSWRSLLQLHREYGIPWTAVPKGMMLAAYLHCLEIPGMKLAFAGGQITDTAYR
jgi:hypothetical protein